MEKGVLGTSRTSYQILLALNVTHDFRKLNISDWSEIGRWNLFASPVSDIVSLCEAMGPSFRHSIAFISSDSPVAIISLAVSGSIFVLPGTTSLVSSISTATSGDELLIIYDSGLARISDAATMELRRSMDLKTATGLINDGGWETWSGTPKVCLDALCTDIH
jgi:hypothetical protein